MEIGVIIPVEVVGGFTESFVITEEHAGLTNEELIEVILNQFQGDAFKIHALGYNTFIKELI